MMPSRQSMCDSLLLLFPFLLDLICKLLTDHNAFKTRNASTSSYVKACHCHAVVHIQALADGHNPRPVYLSGSLHKELSILCFVFDLLVSLCKSRGQLESKLGLQISG